MLQFAQTKSTCVRLPEKVEFMEFYNFKNKLSRPFVVYANFECSLIKSDEPGILQKHEPNSAAFYFVNTFEPIKNKLWSYVGQDCVSKLIIELNELSQECINKLTENNGYHKKRQK